MNLDLTELNENVKKFINDRDWKKFHSPKNISMALSIEASELMEHFQWANSAEESFTILDDKTKKTAIEDEVADVAVYLLDFCNMCNIDLKKAMINKIKKNAKKYPIEKSKGRSDKYTAYE
ncbi:MAG: dCTP diphosphatase [Lysobacterales bacterium]|jgi:dCTP diphosphatase